MTSIKVKFKLAAENGCEGTIYYQIIRERSVRQLASDYKVAPSAWDEHRSTVKIPLAGPERERMLSLRRTIRHDVERMQRIVKRLEEEDAGFSAEDVVEEYGRFVGSFSVCNYFGASIGRLMQNGRVRTAETYRATLNSFKAFLLSREGVDRQKWRACGVDAWDVMLDMIDAELMEAYEAWQRGRGLTPNTISFYMRVMRAVYNRGMEEGAGEDCQPFRHVYTGVDKTVKRALPLALIKRIRSLDLRGLPGMEYARDMFMLSFFMRGMSFVDMAFLKKSDLKNGRVTYRRRKTGQQLVIGWTREMQEIVDRYPANPSDYLFPIIMGVGGNERSVYRKVGYNINRNLKRIAEMIGIEGPLTLYVARHSWASGARAKGIPVSVISEGMGHDSELTTQIYLASLDASVVDRANKLIIKSV